MELEHTFTVPVGPDEAFRVLRDIERIGPCMPGATVESVDGDEFTGRVKVKVGPIQVTYKGTAAFVDVDEAAHSATIEAKAKEARGSGTANATIRASCVGRGDSETEVRVVTELAITGKPAQFGRGVMAEVGDKLLGRFADCLADKLAAGEGEDTPGEGAPRDDAPGEDGTGPSGERGSPGADAEVATGGGGAGAGAGVGVGAAPSGTAAAAAATTAPRAGRTGDPAGTGARVPQPPPEDDNAIDLLDVAGGAVAKRAAPIVAVGLLALVIWLIRRR